MAQTPQKNDHGTTLLQWTIPEYEQHDRSFGWYVAAIVVGGALVVWALVTRNFLFAFIILLAAALLFRQQVRPPLKLKLTFSEDGIDVGGQNFYEYSEFLNFWIIYRPPAKRIYLTFRSGIRPQLILPLEQQNPVDVRRVLTQYLPEDLEREEEPVTESLGRTLKL